MRWTKIRKFLIGQSLVDIRQTGDPIPSAEDPYPPVTFQSTKLPNQEKVHGRIAAGHDQRSSMTGGLLGNGGLFS